MTTDGIVIYLEDRIDHAIRQHGIQQRSEMEHIKATVFDLQKAVNSLVPGIASVQTLLTEHATDMKELKVSLSTLDRKVSDRRAAEHGIMWVCAILMAIVTLCAGIAQIYSAFSPDIMIGHVGSKP